MLLSPNKLRSLLGSTNRVVLLDATWFMPNSPRLARAEFQGKRLPNAQFLDLDQVASSHPLGLKHMMPNGETFARACEKFGIGPSTHVVIYDAHGVFSSPRALFMFQSFGHRNSAILDGGLPRWEAEGLPLETGEFHESEVQETKYPIPSLDADVIKSYEQMVSNSTLVPLQTPGAELVLDARSRGRYLGMDPEPRPGLSSGHIPNSFSLPFNLFLQNTTAANGVTYTTMLPKEQIRAAVIEAVGIERANSVFAAQMPVIASCGSGMTAAVLWLGLQLLEVKRTSIYDESWTGYSMRPSSKIAKAE
ncbi:Rhodanese-like domain-containing protein [Roridomyces roridus]|uniref:Rhodanese-like domain-containing protein n=1 Tax=Roridomyces roridus TaxID=1738132 RepID=A0AAD7BTY6_9AGAR|nr:Rhodanese-like domain-containing protein [Roridomyces roridus]